MTDEPDYQAMYQTLRAQVEQMDARFGHFAELPEKIKAAYGSGAEASPALILGELAGLVREAAKGGPQ